MKGYTLFEVWKLHRNHCPTQRQIQAIFLLRGNSGNSLCQLFNIEMDMPKMAAEEPIPDLESLDVQSCYGEPDDSDGLLIYRRKLFKPTPCKPCIIVVVCIVIIAIQFVLIVQAYAELRQKTTSPSTSLAYASLLTVDNQRRIKFGPH